MVSSGQQWSVVIISGQLCLVVVRNVIGGQGWLMMVRDDRWWSAVISDGP